MPRRRIQAEVRPIEKMWLSKSEAKSYLDCSDDFLKHLRDEALVSFSRYGKMIWYNKESIDSFLEKRMIQPL